MSNRLRSLFRIIQSPPWGRCCAAAVGVLFTTQLMAVGTAANTKIYSHGSNLAVQYKNSNQVLMPGVSGVGSLTSNVSAVYGFSLASFPTDQSAAKSSSANYSYVFQNLSNTTIGINFTENGFVNLGQFGTAWTRNNPANLTGIAADAMATAMLYRVNISSTAKNLSKGVSDLSFALTSSDGAAYTGFNGTLYGGVDMISDIVTSSVAAPELAVLSKTLTVINAPTANGYAGHDHDPVPGSVIEYSILIYNGGDSSSSIADVLEKIPANSIFLSIPTTSEIQENNGTIGALDDVDYDTNGDGLSELGAIVDSYADRQVVQGIRFRISSLAAKTLKTLKYRVTVKE